MAADTGATAEASLAKCVATLHAHLENAFSQFRRYGEKVILTKGSRLISDKVHCLESGKCALCVNDPRGDPISMFYFRPPQMINFLPLLAKCFPFDKFVRQKKVPSDMFHVKALSDCELFVVDTGWFINTLSSGESAAYLVIYSCVLNLLNIYKCVHNSPILSNAQRICLFIISSLDDSPDNVIPAHLTHIEISRHLSIHAVTVAKIISRLRSLGVLEKAGANLRVRDFETLNAIAQGCEIISY